MLPINTENSLIPEYLYVQQIDDTGSENLFSFILEHHQ